MVKINFMPDDYIQRHESRRTNLMYLVLFGVAMTVIVGTFLTIKIRQKSLEAKAALINARMREAKESISQLEQLQAKQKTLIKTALATAELIEPVPRSVILALLTNDLPAGTSLLSVKIVQKTISNTHKKSPTGDKYQTAKNAQAQQAISKEKLLKTHIAIEGIAPSDLEVAGYIARLSSSTILEKVALVQSKEYKVDDTAFREFKLTAELKRNAQLTATIVDKIKGVQKQSIQIDKKVM